MRIGVFEVESWEREGLERLSESHDVRLTREPLRGRNAEEFSDIEVAVPFIYSQLDAPVPEKLPQLRLVSTRSTGINHIDADVCAARKITICNVPNYGENTVAEHVFALLLTISHKVHDAIDRTRKGDFSFEGLRGFDLAGKTIGVIGTGSIGEHVIRIALGFGMRVVAFDIRQRDDLARELGFEYKSLNDLLGKSDVITLHVPGSPKTQHMIGHEQLNQMKRGTVLINTARGSVVDTRAMMQALADGRLLAAGLDVLPEEPTVREEAELLHSMFQKEHDLEMLLADHVLLRQRNVYITPHTAFCTKEAVQRIIDVTVHNIGAFQRGDPQNVVVAGS